MKLHYKPGFALPTVLLMSLTVIIVVTAALQTISARNTDTRTEYYFKVAEEAAESGAAYAGACLEKNNYTQTWGIAGGSKPKLGPATNCSGAANTYPGNAYVLDTPGVRTTFEVGELDTSATYAAQISSTGITQVLGSGGVVNKEYRVNIKKTVVWSTDLVGAKSVSGTYRTCAILSNHVYCWGRYNVGQLGDGRTVYYSTNPEPKAPDVTGPGEVPIQATPVRVSELAPPFGWAGQPLTDIFTTTHNSCVLSLGNVYCWGYNAHGQLGDGTRIDRSRPVRVDFFADNGLTVTAIGGAGNTSCAVAGGKIYCWGSNSVEYRTAGTGGTPQSYTTPQLVAAGGANGLPTNYVATKLSTSGSRSTTMCAIADGKAYCWGQNNVGQVGDNTTSANRNVPTKVYDNGVLSGKTLVDISQDGTNVSPTEVHACALSSDGKVFCWGNNARGQLGVNSNTSSAQPVQVTGGGFGAYTVSGIAVGLSHTCAYTTDNNVWCWGDNVYGQLGDGTKTRRLIPTRIVKSPDQIGNKIPTSIGGGSNRGCVVVNTGQSYCWGRNQEGQLGDGTRVDSPFPVEALFLRPNKNQYLY